MGVILPLATAVTYGLYAWAPQDHGEDVEQALATLFIAQIPLALLAAIFAGVATLPGPMWRRVVVYVGMVTVIALVSGMSEFAADHVMGPILGWGIAIHVVLIIFGGPQPELASARLEAVARDTVNLSLLTIVAMVIAVLATAIVERPLRVDWQIALAWSDISWLCAIYFCLRAWSAAYVFTPSFAERRQGFVDRKWIDSVFKKESSSASDY